MNHAKQILITGGYGFIGSHLIIRLFEKFPEAILVNVDSMTYAASKANLPPKIKESPRYHHLKIDIFEQETMTQALSQWDFDWVFHLAAESHVDNSILNPKRFLETNVMGTFHLLQHCLPIAQSKPNFKFLHASTDEVYGTLGLNDAPFNEQNPYLPNSPYAASKASSDHLVRSYVHTYGFPAFITNCSNNFGPNQHAEKLIPTVIQALKNQKKIPVYGTGKNIRDWLFVVDHVEALIAVVQKGTLGESYNIGGKQEWENLRLVKQICKIYAVLTHTSERENEALIEMVTDRKGHDFRYAIDTKKIQKELGWEPRFSFEKALTQTIESYL